MRIELLLALIPLTLCIRVLAKTRGYAGLISFVSVFLIFLLQPEIPVRYLSFWLPIITIALIVFSWLIITPLEDRNSRTTIQFIHSLGLFVLLIGLFRYLDLNGINLVSRPPQWSMILIGLLFLGTIGVHISRIPTGKMTRWSSFIAICLLLIIFIILKNQTLSLRVNQTLRDWAGQSMMLSGSIDIRWFGYSYIAFRLIHTLRDFQNRRLPAVSLQEYFNYVLFFPTLSAGPIDRLDRFTKDLRHVNDQPELVEDVLMGGKRLVLGIFKKFFIADSLAVIALNSTNLSQVTSTRWLWVLLYAYALQIYFDFSGYSDIAIGLARIMGIHTPENFNNPYLKSNITQFWNSWHMTLTQWVRTYLFNPLARYLRTSVFKAMPVLVMLLGQLATMLFIGLWHGITVNFLIWGIWHTAGLFVQNRWTALFRGVNEKITNQYLRWGIQGVSTLITFNFVTLGWIWFALPYPEQSITAMGKLFGWSW